MIKRSLLVVVLTMAGVLVGGFTTMAATDFSDLCVAGPLDGGAAYGGGGVSGISPGGAFSTSHVGTTVLANTGATLDTGVWLMAALTLVIAGLAILLASTPAGRQQPVIVA